MIKVLKKGIEIKYSIIFVNDEVTTICANIISQLIESENVGNFFTVFMQGKEKILLKNL